MLGCGVAHRRRTVRRFPPPSEIPRRCGDTPAPGNLVKVLTCLLARHPVPDVSWIGRGGC